MKLTAKAVQAARYTGRPAKLFDGAGLFLHVTPTGRTWRYRYRLDGKSRDFTIGPADVVSLSDAREQHRAARRLVLAGRDPVAERRADAERARRPRGPRAPPRRDRRSGARSLVRTAREGMGGLARIEGAKPARLPHPVRVPQAPRAVPWPLRTSSTCW